ncbi:TetR/AcrR family transcriptional regulator [Actinoplanes teichomyceticus]|uniref:TetR family transcriptional regulator n=1 Tax=Actinoplanes teichomyceticus TaxID=1867 RepID=A0A561WKN8_ACTTI|nr:TetR/AcrR family transcriptional regulator [Actinoplanes teichomyceticus]TWG24403.1 TetR family transcriptional regulator [Actinoplanes teichomyceticus]GIF12746.1 TetR family transcriptional regulator [Actinoplanes teichomyceticus]
MARWQPGTRDRLAAAALELFRERGFDQTTVTDIATRAGLDKRTFYRLFGDKREALFSGGQMLQDMVVEALTESDAAPFDAVVAGFDRVAREIFADRLEFARARQSIIAASPELTERELHKMASLAAAVAAALRAKGVGDTAATLAAESGCTVFRVAFARWVSEPGAEPLADLIAEVTAELRAVTSAA